MSLGDDASVNSVSATVRLVNRNGLHARPAHLFVQVANGFSAEVRVAKGDGDAVDGKSIMSMMTLAAPHGAELVIHSSGSDAADQVAALRKLVEDGFDED